MFGAMLASLFGFLYVLLSLETYSLLVGSLGLFLVLSLVMALTQRVKWLAAARTAEA
jgi:inner membrane protein